MNDKFKEVIEISSTIPSIYVHNTYFSMFDQHTRGLGMNFISRIDYEGGCLDINGQDIFNPFMAQGRQKYQGLGYGWREFGECPKRLEEHQPSKMRCHHLVKMLIHLPSVMNTWRDLAWHRTLHFVMDATLEPCITLKGAFQCMEILNNCEVPLYIL